jgi:putative hydrolase of the HAD superfamily
MEGRDMPGYLIWDFDGTLGFRRGGMWTASLIEVLREHDPGTSVASETIEPFTHTGFPWHEPEVVRPAGITADEWWARLEPVFIRAYTKGAGLPSNLAQDLAQRVRTAYTRLDKWALLDDTASTLRVLAERSWRHLVLSNHVPELNTIISHLGIESQFDHVYNSATTGVEKPHSKAFDIVTEGLPTDASTWMIGDSYKADVLGAEGVGIRAILVRRKHPQAKRQCSDLTGVTEIVGYPI